MNNINPNYLNCIYNLLYVQFNEIFDVEEFFSFDMSYPIFYNVKNGYFQVDKKILSNINQTVLSNLETFRNGLYEEVKKYNTEVANDEIPKRTYNVTSSYDITFSKNHLLSFILNLNSLSDNEGPEYEELYSYNLDLLNGNSLSLKDLFYNNVNYIKLLSDYVNSKIKDKPSVYYPDTVIEIPESQAFYITDKGIVLYFALEEISPKKIGLPKFLISFEEFGQYINPRFYCNPQNVFRRKKR